MWVEMPAAHPGMLKNFQAELIQVTGVFFLVVLCEHLSPFAAAERSAQSAPVGLKDGLWCLISLSGKN